MQLAAFQKTALQPEEPASQGDNRGSQTQSLGDPMN